MKHRYVYETDTEGGSAAARVLRQVGFNKKVLELGTGPGSVTRLLKQQGCRVTGVELDPESAELCRPYCERLIVANLDLTDWLSEIDGEVFDVIVAADVLEHLRDPESLLRCVASRLSDEGHIVISIPNANHLTVLACLLTGRFPYQTNGLLDRSHIRFFGRDDLDELLRSAGYLWQRWEAARLEPAHAELQAYWHRLTDEEQRFLQERVVDGSVYQHVVTAYPTSASGHVARVQRDALEARQGFERERVELKALIELHKAAEAEYGVRLANAESVAEMRATEVMQLQVQLTQLHAEFRQLIEVRQHLTLHNHELQSTLNGLQSTLNELRAVVQQQMEVVNEQVGENHLLRAERELVFQSHSWRMTAPIRSLARLFGRGRKSA